MSKGQSLQDNGKTTTTVRRLNAFQRLYRGETSFDFVHRRKWWFLISSVVILAGVISLATRGLNLGIDFKGGTSWELTAPGLSSTTVRNSLRPLGLGGATIITLGGRTVQVEADLASESATARRITEDKVTSTLAKLAKIPTNQVSVTTIGPSWGSQITHKAVLALIVFFLAIAAYITIRFEWKMAMAAIVAVIHDILVTVGIYSLTGFQVTPDTVVAVLTILGYSLYDTIVVFDRVQESVKGLGASGKLTYEDTVNLSMNQVLARSVNTSLVAVIPILAVLLIGAQLLGATTLQYFGLALLIGLVSGAYSSLFIASPLLAAWKEREPRYATIRQRLQARGEGSLLLTPAAAAASGFGTSVGSHGGSGLSKATVTSVGSKGRILPGSSTSGRRGRSSSIEPSNGARKETALASSTRMDEDIAENNLEQVEYEDTPSTNSIRGENASLENGSSLIGAPLDTEGSSDTDGRTIVEGSPTPPRQQSSSAAQLKATSSSGRNRSQANRSRSQQGTKSRHPAKRKGKRR
ncbi:MAG: protein translocase subunit SecF [Actinobacteria bacterium]|nr:protein translocase subunit SecF [Actinomycetota bacterium]